MGLRLRRRGTVGRSETKGDVVGHQIYQMEIIEHTNRRYKGEKRNTVYQVSVVRLHNKEVMETQFGLTKAEALRKMEFINFKHHVHGVS